MKVIERKKREGMKMKERENERNRKKKMGGT